jgi:Hypervirulence associated proteins TUDOR domain
MAKRFETGAKVKWNTSQGQTSGRVVKKLTKPTRVKGHRVAASEGSPEYLVQSDKSGKIAAHKPSALTKRSKRTSS